jgi:hypothetical protein
VKKAFVILALLSVNSLFAGDLTDLDSALANVRQSCSGISEKITRMKIMAGVNIAVTGGGTAAGIGATAVGFVKQAKDKKIGDLEELIESIKQTEQDSPEGEADEEQIIQFSKDFEEYLKNPDEVESDIDKLTKESIALGNWRTGLLAGNAATNVAGAIIAGNNQVDNDLDTVIKGCKFAAANLRVTTMQAKLDGETDAQKLAKAENIISNCEKWNTVDLSKINNRGKGAMWSAIAGAATGGAGTLTSAIANADKIRDDNTDAGKKKEKNLNTASNFLAIGATAASATSTVFNAMQIAAIKRAEDATTACEEALK